MRLLPLLSILPTLVLGPISASLASDEEGSTPVILAVFAHADDEIVVAPLLAKFAREGANVYLAIATDGRFGVAEHADVPAGEELVSIREKEARCAAKKLGINSPYFFGLSDGFSHRSDSVDQLLDLQSLLKSKVRFLINELRPETVITWGPDGGYGHPDHRIVGSIVSETFQSGASVWPQRLLFPGFSATRLRQRLTESESPLANHLAGIWRPVDEKFLDVRISVADRDWKAARASMACYASQAAPGDMDPLADFIHDSYGGVVTLRSWDRPGVEP